MDGIGYSGRFAVEVLGVIQLASYPVLSCSVCLSQLSPSQRRYYRYRQDILENCRRQQPQKSPGQGTARQPKPGHVLFPFPMIFTLTVLTKHSQSSHPSSLQAFCSRSSFRSSGAIAAAECQCQCVCVPPVSCVLSLTGSECVPCTDTHTLRPASHST